MPTPGANLQYGNPSFLCQTFLRKMGFQPRARNIFNQQTRNLNGAADVGTSTPRLVGICAKYSVSTAPTTNLSGDQPTGKGDICIYFGANVSNASRVPLANIAIYRCSAYTNSTTFTWTQIVA